YVKYETGKKIAWAFLGTNILIFVAVLELLSGNYLGSDRTHPATFLIKSFNTYFLIINYIIFTITAVLSLFNVEEEHNYGSIITALAVLTLFAAIEARRFYPVQMIMPVQAFMLLAGIFVHWIMSLHYKAHYDPLLKIYNRQYMNNIISGIADISLGKTFSVMMCDIDHFKKVNDTYGHKAGDIILYWVAQTIRESALPEGITCRYGGEEIIVFACNKPEDEATLKAEKIRKAVKKMKVKVEEKAINVTLSIGVSGTETGIKDMDKLLKRADAAVYMAKEQGRDRVVRG
ncbi:MAG: diguanylate cyclase, partial [Actinomycetia bacterium]|nr:diguanylate cyclase [Actinomycetes bacterium]